MGEWGGDGGGTYSLDKTFRENFPDCPEKFLIGVVDLSARWQILLWSRVQISDHLLNNTRCILKLTCLVADHKRIIPVDILK